MDPSQAVARLMRVQARSGHTLVSNANYIPGHFYRFVPKAGLSAGTMKVAALVFRGDTVAVAKENMLMAIGDRLCTGPDTLAIIEFLIGGRVGVNASTETVIVTERSVADGDTPLAKVFMKNLKLLTKWDAKALKQPLEIQTNGGTMAIKG